MVAVPEMSHKFKVAASPPMLRVVAVALKRLAVSWLVAKVPELALMLPVAVIVPSVDRLPEEPVKEKWAEVILFAPSDRALAMSVSDRSKALVIPPPAAWILIPAGKGSLVSRFSTKSN